MYESRAKIIDGKIEIRLFLDGEQLSMWEIKDIPESWDASVALAETEQRIQQYINAHADVVDRKNRAALAQALVDSLDRRVWPLTR